MQTQLIRTALLFAAIGALITGCKSTPATPPAPVSLQGQPWIVEDINGAGIIDKTQASIDFGSDMQLTGSATCNNYTAKYSQKGDKLIVSQAANTRKLCPPALMDQETKFLDILTHVERFEVKHNGALMLYTKDKRAIRARRQS